MLPVVVDSSGIVQGDWLLDSPAWRVLLHLSRRQPDRILVVPEVVIREAVGRFSDHVTELVGTMDSATRRLARLGVPPGGAPVDIAAAVAKYERHLRDTLGAGRALTPDPPEVDLLGLVDRAIYRRRPFDAKGSGFRDALIWEAVIAAGRSTLLRRAAFVVKDKVAFHEHTQPGSLAPELVDELNERGVLDIQIYASVREFLVANGVTDPKLTLAVTTLVDDEHAQIATNLVEAAQGFELTIGYDQPGVVSIDEMIPPSDISVEHVTPGDEGLALVDLRVDAELVVRLEADPWDRDDVVEDAIATIDVSFTASTTYDPMTGELDSRFSVDPIEVERDEILANAW